ncbi:hypothetical protein DVH24_010572, partial [Malus domestica]
DPCYTVACVIGPSRCKPPLNPRASRSETRTHVRFSMQILFHYVLMLLGTRFVVFFQFETKANLWVEIQLTLRQNIRKNVADVRATSALHQTHSELATLYRPLAQAYSGSLASTRWT